MENGRRETMDARCRRNATLNFFPPGEAGARGTESGRGGGRGERKGLCHFAAAMQFHLRNRDEAQTSDQSLSCSCRNCKA